MKNKSLLLVLLMVIVLAVCCTGIHAEPPQDFEPEKIQFYQDYFQQEELDAFKAVEFWERQELELQQSYTQLAQSELPQDEVPINKDDLPIAQSIPRQTYVQPSLGVPLGSVETNITNQYGIVGFIVVTALGLVVYVVRSDRATMTGLTAAIQANAVATQKHAEATRRLAEKVDDKLDSLANDIRTQFAAVNNLIAKLEDNSR